MKNTDMQKYLPYLFPSIAILLVAFLLFRWYRLNTQHQGIIPEFAQGIEIEDLSSDEAQAQLGMSDSVETQSLTLTDETMEGMGELRYELGEDNKVRFSVYANLPESEGSYQVWLKDPVGDALRKAFVLESGKGGYLGSAAISQEVLPFSVMVSEELNPDDNSLEKLLLEGMIEADPAVLELSE